MSLLEETGGHGLDRDPRFAEEVVERGQPGAGSVDQSFGVALSIGLREQDAEQSRAVEDHRGSPCPPYGRSPWSAELKGRSMWLAQHGADSLGDCLSGQPGARARQPVGLDITRKSLQPDCMSIRS